MSRDNAHVIQHDQRVSDTLNWKS